MQNDDYIYKGIYRFKLKGIGSMFRLFISTAIPKNEFDGILQEIQSLIR